MVHNGEFAYYSEMKAATTAAEWKVLAEFQLASFNARQLVYGNAAGGNWHADRDVNRFLPGGGMIGESMLSPADVGLIGEQVESVMVNPARTAKATQVLGELTTEIGSFNQAFIYSGDTPRDLYLDQEAGPRQTL